MIEVIYRASVANGGKEGGNVTFSEIKQFAQDHRLKTVTDECGESVIRGKTGHVYQYSDSLLAVMFLPPVHRPRLWGNWKRAAEGLCMALVQNGDSEGCLTFDHDNKEQVRLALRIGKIRQRKQLSPERKEQLTALLATARNPVKPTVGGHLTG